MTADRLNRRTCPSTNCGIVGQFFFREAVDPLEVEGEWVRVTAPYPASCVNGQSAFVDSGDASCSPANGIENGQLAEWVSASSLSSTRPDDPAEGAQGTEALVAGSDDFRIYREPFVAAAESLIASGQCTAKDLIENGGFVKSSNHASRPIYFTYCGGATVANRLYLNAETGQITR